MDNENLLKIIIVGAGLSGLGAAISCASAGHGVHVIESTKVLTEVNYVSYLFVDAIPLTVTSIQVGAGLQITPNASRLFKHWKLPNSVFEAAAEPTALTVHRYSGEVLAREDSFDKNIRRKYGAPFVDMHRADLQLAMYKRAVDLGVTFSFNERVHSIDYCGPTITTTAGNGYSGDLIIAADGLWSRCRECFLGSKAEPSPTGDLAYRIVLPLDDIREEELKKWVKHPEVHFWAGPGAHAVGYSLRAGNIYNLGLLVPDDLPPGISKQEASLEEMKKLFEGWDPILTRFLDCVNKVEKWKLMHREEMPSWVNEESNLVFIGDSCHPMLPYLAQGANLSLEDGAVLGELLGKLTDKKQLPHILSVYQQLRKGRGEAVARETFKQRHDFHLPDGPEQRERDAVFLSRLHPNESTEPFPSRWTCPQVQPWLYGYDAIKEVEDTVSRDPVLSLRPAPQKL
ncbi:hypothetical protein AJ80_08926 [Polytolypa hystricis UAMH7299]|uniref:FAD-binding domain-containing protein n=1 Tax=Polytolypa hystricis (strain UAMH7299) TaxID=1447883 RepID=A0A2B7WZX5_POLH7|nr:hypothetical protein AJ80_08926 [Polytolypa hystricis UAMH7299]